MDLMLEVFDTFVFDKVYAQLLPVGSPPTTNLTQTMAEFATRGGRQIYGVSPTHFFPVTEYASLSRLPRSSILRQAISFQILTWGFGCLSYIITAGLSYYFLYDHDNFNHPRFIKNQVRLEIKQAMRAMPIMSLMTVPWFLFECQGYSRLYDNISDHGKVYFYLQFPLFVLFTDMLVYLAHRWLHHPWVYRHLHKPHHKWLVPSPFASHAFHPVDGYVQSLPYHIFPMIFPLHKVAYICLFGAVNVWSVMIHDGEYMAHDPIINGSACHTIHHLYFNYNFGQYTTLWDRIGGTHRTPDRELFDPRLKKNKSTWDKQTKSMDEIRREVEGDENDRVYAVSSGFEKL